MHLLIFQNWLRASLKWLVISLLFALSVVSCTYVPGTGYLEGYPQIITGISLIFACSTTNLTYVPL